MKRLSKSFLIIALTALLAIGMAGCQSTAVKTETLPPAPEVEEKAPEAAVEVPVVVEVEVPAEPEPEPAPEPEPQPEPAPVEKPEAEVTPVVKSDYPYGVDTTVISDDHQSEFDVYIGHTTNMLGVLQGEYGGMTLSQLSTLVKSATQYTDKWVLFNTGFFGVSEENALDISRAIDEVGYTAYTAQPVQLAYGVEGTEKAVPLSSNALDENGYLRMTPFQVYSFDGFKMAVFALNTPIFGLDNIDFLNEEVLNNAQFAVDMAHKVADYVVVLTDAAEYAAVDSDYIAENLNGIDLIIDSGLKAEYTKVNDTRIIHADSVLGSLGVIQLHVKDGKVKTFLPLTVPASAVTDPANSPLVQQYADQIAALGYSATDPVPADPAVEPYLPYPYGVKMIEKSEGVEGPFDLIVAHTNDVHARVDKYIGYARLATMVDTARDITDNFLLLDAGDTTHGTNIANMFQGEPIDVLLAMLGYDAIAPGNHDFNYGFERLLEEDQEARAYSDMKVLCSNLTAIGSDLPVFQPYQLYDFNGFTVGVIGLSTPDTVTTSHPKNTEGLDFHADDFYERTQRFVDMVGKYADYVIALGHIGMDDNAVSGVTSLGICENVKGIDLFVDGHSHHVLEHGQVVGDTLIVQAGEYMKNVGVVDILVENDEVKGTNALLITKDDVLDPANSDLAKQYGIVEVPADPEVENYIASVQKELDALMDVVVAEIPRSLDGERAHVRTRPTDLAKLICAAMTEESGADCTITNGGGIRASMKAGKVTKGDINTVLPFTNILNVCELTGQQIYDAMEHGYSNLPETAGSYAQTDLKVVYNRFAKPGKRILKIFLPDGKVIDRNAVYRVATNDFMAAGGDGYTMFANPVFSGRMLNEVFGEYLAKLYPVK